MDGAPHLLGFWPLLGSTIDYSGNGHTAWQLGPPVLTADHDGIEANDYAFDGVGDYLEIPADPGLQPALPVAIAAWVKPSADCLAQFTCPIFMNDDSAASSGVGLQLNSLGNTALHVQATTGDAGNATSKVGGTVLTPGEWVHVAAVIRGAGEMDVY